MLQKLDDRNSGVERDSDGSWSVFSSSDSGSESEPPRPGKTRVVPLAGGCGALFQGSETGRRARRPAINPAIQLPGRRETTNKAFSSQDERTPGKEEEMGKDGTVWTVVGEEESRGKRQSQNVLTARQIQDAQTAFLCLVDAEILIHVRGCRLAEARRVLADDSSSDMSVDELKAFLAQVYVRKMKGGHTMELSSFWSD
ncbi:hypothetical protein CHARACLAT_021044 [Characodon lateralis]|uniref:Uncharacterized protein n=1 Tax=Characodon lateralis TaxID=208331 RepID=A0ABU7EDD5_9TELE|nr:hypothetical protein [Characodon lateralis]